MPFRKLSRAVGSMLGCVLIWAAGPLLEGASPVQSAPPVLVLRGATVIDALGNPPIPDGVIVVEGEEIRAVGRAGQVSVPRGAEEVDLSGRYVIPGLIDTHVHWGSWMGELYINHGVTSVMAQLNVSRGEREAARTSMSTPRVFHTGGRIQIEPGMSRQQVEAVVRQYLGNEPDVGWFPQFRENIQEAYRWAAEGVHRAGLVVFSHAQDSPGASDAGMDVAEHVWGFSFPLMTPDQLADFKSGRFLHWANYLKEGPELDAAIRRVVARGVYLNPTLVYEWGSLSPRAREREEEGYRLFSDPDLSYFPKELGRLLLFRHRQIKLYSSRYEHLPLISKLRKEDLAEVQEARRNVERFVKRYVDLGGRIVSGTDASAVAIPGLAQHHELELLVEAGLTPLQALQSATSWAAEMLAGIKGARGNQRVGSIKAGNYADLLVLSGDPLASISNTRKLERVMKGGRFLDFGYHPDFYSFPVEPPPSSMAVPIPEISAITPHKVVEGASGFEIVLEGAGFLTNSIVRADGISLETVFEGPRRLRARVPAELVAKVGRDRFSSPGPDQNVAIFGDSSLSITVLNSAPTGGVSNSVALLVQARWRVD